MKLKYKGLNKLREASKRLKALYISEMKKLVDDAIPITIEAAEQATPPNVPGSGGKGKLAKAWAKDSSKKSKLIGNKISFTLANKVKYAKWVNDGHNMTLHFVPGLHIINGELIFDDNIPGGIMVGTQTDWVKGFYMTDKAKKAFYSYIKQNYMKRMKDLWAKAM